MIEILISVVGVCLLCLLVFTYVIKQKKQSGAFPPQAPFSYWKAMTGSGMDRLTEFHNCSKWCETKFPNNIQSGTTFLFSTPFFGFGSYSVACCDYKLARTILSGSATDNLKEAEKTMLIQNLNIFDKVCSLLTYKTADPQRSQSRKFIAPSFSTSNLQKTTLNILYENVHTMMTSLNKSSASGEVVDIKKLAVVSIFDILTKSLFNVSLRGEDGKDEEVVSGFDYKEFLKAQDDAMREAVKRVLIPFRRYMTWLPAVKEGSQGQQKLIQFAKVVLQAFRESKGITSEHTDGEVQAMLKDDKSIMAHILSNSYPSEEHRLSDVIVFLVAGHETTAHSLSFFLYCMAKHPEAKAKLQSELDMLTPTGTTHIYEDGMEGKPLLTLSDIARCDFLSHCLKESQRLYPVAPLISRTTLSDVHHNGMTIPKNSTVLVVVRSMFRANWIDRADEYLPERWEESAPQAGELKDLFMPFSIGKRSCIGQNLALMELRVIMANILRNYDVSLEGSADPELDYFVTLKPVELHMKVSQRI